MIGIISDCDQDTGDRGKATLFCSSTGWAFGPVFESRDQASEFLAWLDVDPRSLEDRDLELRYTAYRAARRVRVECQECRGSGQEADPCDEYPLMCRGCDGYGKRTAVQHAIWLREDDRPMDEPRMPRDDAYFASPPEESETVDEPRQLCPWCNADAALNEPHNNKCQYGRRAERGMATPGSTPPVRPGHEDPAA